MLNSILARLPRTSGKIGAGIGVALIALVLLAGCSGPAAIAPKPTPTPHPPDVTGQWKGCIHGINGQPNEQMSLQISGEQPNGLLTGVYSEDFTYLGVAIIIKGSWDIAQASVGVDKKIAFTTYPVETILGYTGPETYAFTGSLVSADKMAGKVKETTVASDTLPWTLSKKGDCPY